MENDILRPIKIVVPREEDIIRPDYGGGSTTVFGEVTQEIRDALKHQVGEVDRYFQTAFRQFPKLPVVARIILKSKALAKSHRPTSLFARAACPIIGVGDLGELYIGARKSSLESLSHQLQRLSTKTGIANISTIQKITPYTAADALGTHGKERILERLQSGVNTLKFRLFRHHDARVDQVVYQAFLSYIEQLGLQRPKSVYYAPGLRIFKIANVREDNIEPLAHFVGTQSLTPFPRYRVHRTVSRSLGPLITDDFPPPERGFEYPIVGIIDSGIDPSNAHLSPWIYGREEYVPPGDRDHDHGTFVSGLAVHAQRLNQHPKFPDVSSRLLDVQAMPASTSMSEDDLLAIIEEVVPKYPDVKVWNLSLSRDEPCDDQYFSDFAIALDAIQEKHKVTFIIAAGNYSTPPLRNWPPDDLGENDRIAPPADSVRAISVGSLAHLDRPNTRVRRNQPSPFSRRGPGPVYLPKPELVHYGGNCDVNGSFMQTGVISTNAQGLLAENIGTSFAAPMIATLLANIQNALASPPSRNLAKALLVHSAVFDSPPILAEDLKYRGFGIPGDLMSVLTCKPWSATLIFETDLVPGLEFSRLHFPIPDCLRGPKGVVCGEILMTAVCEPPLDASFGAEYCRTNVDVSLGTYDIGKNNKPRHRKQIPPEPKDASRMWESELVEHGFKWAPVKVYRRNMKRVQGENWRLKVTVYNRSGFESKEPQQFALVITIRDPKKQQPVYDEVVTKMQNIGWSTIDLQIHERVRTRA